MLTLCYVDIHVYLCRWGIQSWIMRVLCEDVLVTNHLPKYYLLVTKKLADFLGASRSNPDHLRSDPQLEPLR